MFQLSHSAGRMQAIALSLLLLGGVQVTSAGWIHAKAMLAQLLIADAWDQSLQNSGQPVRPWPWADTWPVGRLQVPDLGVDQYILAGAGGNALAFGPGHHSLTALPGHSGHSMLAGHRDTHFSFLRRLRRGTRVQVQDVAGQLHSYRVTDMQVVDIRRTELALPETSDERLWLLTCYPFDAVTSGGDLRYLVSADPVPPAAQEELHSQNPSFNPAGLARQEEYHL